MSVETFALTTQLMGGTSEAAERVHARDAEHAKRKMRGWKKALIGLGVLLLIFVVGVTGGGFYLYHRYDHKVSRQDLLPDAAGTGAIFAWSGNDKVGEGRMTIVESRPAELVRIKLDFNKPFEDTSTSEFAFKPEGGGAGTVVTWRMYGDRNFISKAF